MVSREGKTWECYQSTDALLLHAIVISPFAFCFSSCWVIALFIKHELVDREHFSSVRDYGHTARLHAARDQRELTCYAGLCCGMLHRFLSLRQILTAERSHRKQRMTAEQMSKKERQTGHVALRGICTASVVKGVSPVNCTAQVLKFCHIFHVQYWSLQC